VLVALAMMLQLQLPHVNVLSKFDLVQQKGHLHRNVDFYTSARSLAELVAHLPPSYRSLSLGLCELVEEFNLVSFSVLDIAHPQLLSQLVKDADKANGYVYGEGETTALVETYDAPLDIADVYEHYCCDNK
jgi:hypothetical protein